MSYCVRKTMVDEIKKNATGYVISKDMTRITVPASNFNKGTVNQIVDSLYKRGIELFGKFGNSLSMDKRDPYNPAILVHPTKQLIQAYEEKEARKKQESITKRLSKEDIARKEEGNWKMDDEGNIIPYYQLPTGVSIEQKESFKKTIGELAARISDRIGINYKIINDPNQKFKGKLEGGVAVINLAYATPDTPIHEILGHPIIKAIKNNTVDGNSYKFPVKMSDGWVVDVYIKDSNEVEPEYFRTEKEAFDFYNSKVSSLYRNLLKELEYGKGKEVLDRIKRDYKYKNKSQEDIDYDALHYFEKDGKYYWWDEQFYVDGSEEYKEIPKSVYNKKTQKQEYTLEEQQEEAIVELLGMMTADKLDAVKDGKLISLLKRLLKEIKAFMRALLRQREVEIDKLPDNMTLEDLSNLLAYSNSKLILPGNEVIYTTPDNRHFKTYAEASKHVSILAATAEEIDLGHIKLYASKVEDLPDRFSGFIELDPTSGDGYDIKVFKKDGKFFMDDPFSDVDTPLSPGQALEYYNTTTSLSRFIDKNKQFEQSKEIVEEWKKINDIKYDPYEVYSRGQEFVSVIGAYSDFDVKLMMQNLLHHIEDNEKAGGEFVISAFTRPVDKRLHHIEGHAESRIRFKIYPKSEDIKWAATSDVYSGSVWDAAKAVKPKKQSELLGVSYTKYPDLDNLRYVQPNLANIIDNLEHHHNELGIRLTGKNFRLEYDENIPLTTKRILNNINAILDERYGKVEKPTIQKKEKQTVMVDNLLPKNMRSGVIKYDSDKEGGYFLDTIEATERRGYPVGERIFSDKVKRILQAIYPNSVVTIEDFTGMVLVDGKQPKELYYPGLKYETGDKIEKEISGALPNKNWNDLIKSVEDIKSEVLYSKAKTARKEITKAEYDAVKSSAGEWTEDGITFYKDSDLDPDVRYERIGDKYTKLNYAKDVGTIKDDFVTIESRASLFGNPDLKGYIIADYKGDFLPKELGDQIFDSYEDADKAFQKYKNSISVYKKNYANQALINLKVAKLKEAAKKYPRSLIRSEVKSIKRAAPTFDDDDLPFQRIPSENQDLFLHLSNELSSKLGFDNPGYTSGPTIQDLINQMPMITKADIDQKKLEC